MPKKAGELECHYCGKNVATYRDRDATDEAVYYGEFGSMRYWYHLDGDRPCPAANAKTEDVAYATQS